MVLRPSAVICHAILTSVNLIGLWECLSLGCLLQLPFYMHGLATIVGILGMYYYWTDETDRQVKRVYNDTDIALRTIAFPTVVGEICISYGHYYGWILPLGAWIIYILIELPIGLADIIPSKYHLNRHWRKKWHLASFVICTVISIRTTSVFGCLLSAIHFIFTYRLKFIGDNASIPQEELDVYGIAAVTFINLCIENF